MGYRIDRLAYAQTYGPTVGDRLRLADTELIIEVEQDYTTYGDEVKFGGGKVIRDGMGQSPITNADGAVDMVITNALILDWWGIVKADIGIKAGFVETTIEAFKNRAIHTYHTEGAGGGHAPDIIRVCGLANVLPSSTNPVFILFFLYPNVVNICYIYCFNSWQKK